MLAQSKKWILRNPRLELALRTLRSLVPYRFRKLDKVFWSHYNLLFEAEKWSVQEVQAYQFRKLKALVEKAYSQSSFYRNKYDNAGFKPSSLKSLEDIRKIPFLTRDEVRGADPKTMFCASPRKIIRGGTSGTTGKALTVFSSPESESREWASICYQWSRIGYLPNDGRVEFRGFIDSDADYVFFPDFKILRINIVKLSEKNIEDVLFAIEKSGYQFVLGYPSALWKFAKILQSKKICFQPRGIMLASEVVYDWQMRVIDQVFTCPKIAHYGQAEKVSLGAWDSDRKYHFIPLYGVVEHDKESKALTATSLINELMPLIRYQLSDVVEYLSDLPVGSKTLFPVASDMSGREDDNTFDARGNIIPPAVVTFPFKHLNVIDNAKLVQRAVGSIELTIESTHDRKSPQLQAEIEGVLGNLRKIYGDGTSFDVAIVDKIPIGTNGKYRWIECKVND